MYALSIIQKWSNCQLFQYQVHKVLKMLETPYFGDSIVPNSPKDSLPETGGPVPNSPNDSLPENDGQVQQQHSQLENFASLRDYFSKPPIHGLGLCVT